MASKCVGNKHMAPSDRMASFFAVLAISSRSWRFSSPSFLFSSPSSLKQTRFEAKHATIRRGAKDTFPGGCMNKVLLTLSIGVVLGGMAYPQVASQPAASPVISANKDVTDEDIKPEHPVAGAADSTTDVAIDPASLLPDLPPVPRANATLIGGTIEKLDRVQDQITVYVFGGGRMKVMFDPRTQIYIGGKQATTAELHAGERISLDTILDGNTVFARNVRVKAGNAAGENEGVVLDYREDRGELTLRDSLSPSPVHIRLTSATRLVQGDRALPLSALVPGTLIGIQFDSEGNNDVAREISILALPGVLYTFTGKVAYLNLSTGWLVVRSAANGKSYEIYLDPSKEQDENLHAGVQVTVGAGFEGARYVARTITIAPEAK